MATKVKRQPVETFLVRFSDVGARKLTWEERIARPVSDASLVKAIKRKGALMSSGIDVSETSDWGGHIYVGGLRRVGSYLIVPGSGQTA